MFTQSVILAKTRDMESQNELYISFFSNRVVGGVILCDEEGVGK